MPRNRIPLADLGQPGTGLVLAPRVLAMIVAIWAGQAVARSAPDLEQLDLTVRPSDVAAPPRAVLAEPLPPFAAAPADAPENPVDEIDKVGRNPTPNRGPTALGPLGGIGGEEGGVLQELLEKKTIPLFRVRMRSPL